MATDNVYVIGAPGSGIVKIGHSVALARRLTTIQNACPVKVEILWHTEGGVTLEGRLHAEFGDRRSCGEWFNFGDEDPVAVIREAAERLRPETDASGLSSSEVVAMLESLRREREEGHEAVRETPGAIEDALRAGKSAAEIARHLGISESYVRGIRREKGLQDPRYAHLRPPSQQTTD